MWARRRASARSTTRSPRFSHALHRGVHHDMPLHMLSLTVDIELHLRAYQAVVVSADSPRVLRHPRTRTTSQCLHSLCRANSVLQRQCPAHGRPRSSSLRHCSAAPVDTHTPPTGFAGFVSPEAMWIWFRIPGAHPWHSGAPSVSRSYWASVLLFCTCTESVLN
jgi:hypothetical protein